MIDENTEGKEQLGVSTLFFRQFVFQLQAVKYFLENYLFIQKSFIHSYAYNYLKN